MRGKKELRRWQRPSSRGIGSRSSPVRRATGSAGAQTARELNRGPGGGDTRKKRKRKRQDEDQVFLAFFLFSSKNKNGMDTSEASTRASGEKDGDSRPSSEHGSPIAEPRRARNLSFFSNTPRKNLTDFQARDERARHGASNVASGTSDCSREARSHRHATSLS